MDSPTSKCRVRHLGASRSQRHDGGMTISPTGVSSLTSSVVQLAGVTKVYPGHVGTKALSDVSLAFPSHTFTAVMGPFRLRKIHPHALCAAGLDRPTSGEVSLAGTVISKLKEPKLTRLRRRHVGFVFQSFNLIEALTVWDNVLLPQRLAGERADRSWAREVIARVALRDKENSRPSQLSGGQQQRVAIARALAGRPDVISSPTNRPARWI